MTTNVSPAADPLSRRSCSARSADSDTVANPALHHYALFSDNVLATAVVVNSTAQAAADPSRHVFHIVTDRMNLGAMQAWFVLNPPRNMTVDIKSLDDFEWINPQYVPVLRQIEQVRANPTRNIGVKRSGW